MTLLRRTFVIGLLLFAGTGLAASASAAPTVYDSPADDGTDPTYDVTVPLGGTWTVPIYGDGGSVASASGVVCEDGSGEEICGWDVLVETRGGVTLLAFRPEGDLQYRLDPTTLRFDGGDHGQGQLGPTKLGEVDVDLAADGFVQLVGGQAVDAGLGLHDLPPTVLLYAPEPGRAPHWLAGIAGLVALARRRARS